MIYSLILLQYMPCKLLMPVRLFGYQTTGRQRNKAMRKLFLGGDWGKRVTSLAHSIAKTLTRVRDPKPKPVLGKDVIVFIIIVLHLLFLFLILLFLLVCFESIFLNKICYLFCSGTEQNNSIIETDIFTGTRTVRKCSKCKGPGHNRRNCTV